MVDAQPAIDALDQMTRVMSAFENARIVLDTLRMAEQQTKQLKDDMAAAHAALAVDQAKVADAQSTSETLLAHARDVVAQAEQAAQAKLDAAARGAAETAAQSAQDKAAADESLSAVLAQVEGVKAALATQQAALDRVNADFSVAKSMLKALAADHI